MSIGGSDESLLDRRLRRLGRGGLLGQRPGCEIPAEAVAAGEVQLVSFDNVNTMFHEFGHALHGFFANPSVFDKGKIAVDEASAAMKGAFGR